MQLTRFTHWLLASAAATLIIPAAPAQAQADPKDRDKVDARLSEPKKKRDRSDSSASSRDDGQRAERPSPRPSRPDVSDRRRDRMETPARSQEVRERREIVRAERDSGRQPESRPNDRFDRDRPVRSDIGKDVRAPRRDDWQTRDRSDEWRAEQQRKKEREEARKNRNPYIDGSRWNRDQRELDRYGHWRRDHWRRDHRYNWRDWRKRHGSRFRIGIYFDPFGYRYRPVHYGNYLGWGYLSSRYIIRDPWYYRLPPAYGPYRWVRYWDDAVLVNIYTGQIVDIEYNVFW